MRVGGPYTVTRGAERRSSRRPSRDVHRVNLGVAQGRRLQLRAIAAIEETVTVTARRRSGVQLRAHRRRDRGRAARSSRAADDLGRLDSFTRLTPQYSGGPFGGAFAGQDNRLNNITVDGSYFNNSFGLGDSPGDRTGVAPISLARHRAGAGEHRALRRAPGQLRRRRRQHRHAQRHQPVQRLRLPPVPQREHGGHRGQRLPSTRGRSTFGNTGVWVSGPIVKNKLFFFGNYEDEALTAARARRSAPTPAERARCGSVTRVLASDLDSLSAFLKSNFHYDTGPLPGLRLRRRRPSAIWSSATTT